MSEKVKRFLCLLMVAVALLGSQMACGDELDSARSTVGDIGCSDTAARDDCGNNTHCRVEACN